MTTPIVKVTQPPFIYLFLLVGKSTSKLQKICRCVACLFENAKYFFKKIECKVYIPLLNYNSIDNEIHL
jgi:hypothetical protein